MSVVCVKGTLAEPKLVFVEGTLLSISEISLSGSVEISLSVSDSLLSISDISLSDSMSVTSGTASVDIAVSILLLVFGTSIIISDETVRQSSLFSLILDLSDDKDVYDDSMIPIVNLSLSLSFCFITKCFNWLFLSTIPMVRSSTLMIPETVLNMPFLLIVGKVFGISSSLIVFMICC